MNKTTIDIDGIQNEIEELNREINALERENRFIDKYLARWDRGD